MELLDKKLGKVLVDEELWVFLETYIGQEVSPRSLPKEVDYFDFRAHAEFMGLAKLEFPNYVDGILDDWHTLIKWMSTMPPEAEAIFDREDVDSAISQQTLKPKDFFENFEALKAELTQVVASRSELEYALACVEVVHETNSLHLLFTNLDWPEELPFLVVRTVNGYPECIDCYPYEPSYG